MDESCGQMCLSGQLVDGDAGGRQRLHARRRSRGRSGGPGGRLNLPGCPLGEAPVFFSSGTRLSVELWH